MERTNKRKEVTHPHFVAVRLTDAEMALLDQGASILGISRSEYLRKLLLEKEITNTIEVIADMDELRRLVGEYGKIGSNLNQIARYFNAGGEWSESITSFVCGSSPRAIAGRLSVSRLINNR